MVSSIVSRFNHIAGRMFDEHGNLASWWNNQSVKAFQEHASCMVNQYGNFTVAGKNVRLSFFFLNFSLLCRKVYEHFNRYLYVAP